MYKGVQRPEAVGSSGAGVIGSWEPPDMGTGPLTVLAGLYTKHPHGRLVGAGTDSQ